MLLEQLIIPLLAKESYKYTLHLIMLHHWLYESNENLPTVHTIKPSVLSYAYASDYMSFQSNNDVITGPFEPMKLLSISTLQTDFYCKYGSIESV
jgi:hypothetical protein